MVTQPGELLVSVHGRDPQSQGPLVHGRDPQSQGPLVHGRDPQSQGPLVHGRDPQSQGPLLRLVLAYVDFVFSNHI